MGCDKWGVYGKTEGERFDRRGKEEMECWGNQEGEGGAMGGGCREKDDGESDV